MAWKRSLLLWGLPLVCAVPAYTAAEDGNASGKWEKVVEPLGDTLHGHMQDAVEYGRNAIGVLRSEVSAMDLAEQDAVVKDHLRKRQETNATVGTTTILATVGTTTVTSSDSSSTRTLSTSSSTVPTTSSTTQSTTTQGRSSNPVSESSEPVVSRSSSTSIVTTSSSTSVQSETPTTVTSTSLISVPASSTVRTTSTASAESTSTIQEPTTTTALVPVTPTTTVAPPASTTAPTTTSRTSTTQQTTSARSPTTQAPASTTRETTRAPTPISTTNVVVDPTGSIITSIPPLATVTDGEGDTVILTSPTPGGVFTASDQGGGIAIVTYYPGGGTVSQVRYITTVLPNGSKSTITSFATVGAPVPTPDESSGAPQATDNPTLQNGAARPSTWHSAEIALIFGAAIGLAGIFL